MRTIILSLALLLMVCLSGCSMFQWAAPHQLWKLNRQPAGGRTDPYFSVPAQSVEQDRISSAVGTSTS